MVQLDNRSVGKATNQDVAVKGADDFSTATAGGADLRQDYLRQSRELPLRGGSPVIKIAQAADYSVADDRRNKDFDRFAAAIANPTTGVGGAAKMMVYIKSAADWTTRPATDSYEPNEFSNQIDPGDKAALALAWKIKHSPTPLGLDGMLKLSLQSVQETYGNRDTTTACVVLANVLKRATAAERADRIEAGNPALKGSVIRNENNRELYRAVCDKMVDYRGDGSPARLSNDIYYHCATLGALYKGGGAGIAIFAAAYENRDISQADDVIEGNAQLQFVQKLGLRSVANPR